MELISRAIAFATRAHDGMRRKSSPIPYIVHPLEAAVIVASMTEDQEVIAAALLHDTVEDAGVAPEAIEAEFGPRVRELVLSETEAKRPELPPEQTWLLRKKEALADLAVTEDLAVKMVYLGDKLSNLRSIDRELQVQGEAMWQCFHQKDPQMHRWYYSAIAEATRELQDTQAWQEYDRLVRKVFHEAKGNEYGTGY